MAERKSDYTGDVFGDWTVTRRVTERQDWMEKGKRYWQVERQHEAGIIQERTVEQTKLKDLPKEDVVKPRALVAVGSNLGWAADLALVDWSGEAPGDLGLAVPDDEDYHVGEAPALESNSVESVRAILGKFDGNHPDNAGTPLLSATAKAQTLHASEIAAKCIAAKESRLADRGILILPPGMEMPTEEQAEDQEYMAALVEAMTTPLQEGWAAKLPVDPAFVALPDEDGGEVLQVVVYDEKCDGLGESAESTVSEAELDGRVEPEAAEKKLVRQLMGEIHTLREQALAAEEQAQEMYRQAENLMDLADALLKAYVTR